MLHFVIPVTLYLSHFVLIFVQLMPHFIGTKVLPSQRANIFQYSLSSIKMITLINTQMGETETFETKPLQRSYFNEAIGANPLQRSHCNEIIVTKPLQQNNGKLTSFFLSLTLLCLYIVRTI